MKGTLGLDIGSHSIKLVEIAKDKTSVTLLAAGSTPTPPKALTSQVEADLQALAVSVQKLIKDSGAKSDTVNIALPESQVFTRVITVPQLSSRELASAIKFEAEQYVPLPLDQVNLDYTVLRDSKETGLNSMEVLLVAGPKALIEKYMTIMEYLEMNVNAIETEIIAASRALVRSVPNVKSVMIISIGVKTTDLAILRNGVLTFTRSISAGGEALTRSIAQKFGFEFTQAEEYKKAYGVEADKVEGKILASVKPILDTIIGETKRAVAFYQQKYRDETIDTILLNGGTARLPGMVVYIAEQVGIETQLANPWVGIIKDSRFNVLDAEGPSFGIAVGLALR